MVSPFDFLKHFSPHELCRHFKDSVPPSRTVTILLILSSQCSQNNPMLAMVYRLRWSVLWLPLGMDADLKVCDPHPDSKVKYEGVL